MNPRTRVAAHGGSARVLPPKLVLVQISPAQGKRSKEQGQVEEHLDATQMPKQGLGRKEVRDMLIIRGLWSELYQLDEVLSSMSLALDNHWLQSGLAMEPPLPSSLEEFQAYAAVVIANANFVPHDTAAQRALAEYVEGGGRLFLLGGSHALGHGFIKGTPIDSLLPVDIEGKFDIEKTGGVVIIPVEGFTLAQDLPWDEAPRAYYVHRVTPRAGATVGLIAGGHPAFVMWSRGQGKVAVLALTVMGAKSKADEIEFWNWPSWTVFMKRVILWLLE